MQPETAEYNKALKAADAAICDLLANEIDRCLPEAEKKSGTRIRCGSSMAIR